MRETEPKKSMNVHMCVCVCELMCVSVSVLRSSVLLLTVEETEKKNCQVPNGKCGMWHFLFPKCLNYLCTTNISIFRTFSELFFMMM